MRWCEHGQTTRACFRPELMRRSVRDSPAFSFFVPMRGTERSRDGGRFCPLVSCWCTSGLDGGPAPGSGAASECGLSAARGVELQVTVQPVCGLMEPAAAIGSRWLLHLPDEGWGDPAAPPGLRGEVRRPVSASGLGTASGTWLLVKAIARYAPACHRPTPLGDAVSLSATNLAVSSENLVWCWRIYLKNICLWVMGKQRTGSSRKVRGTSDRKRSGQRVCGFAGLKVMEGTVARLPPGGEAATSPGAGRRKRAASSSMATDCHLGTKDGERMKTRQSPGARPAGVSPGWSFRSNGHHLLPEADPTGSP